MSGPNPVFWGDYAGPPAAHVAEAIQYRQRSQAV
jgi:hypothetical protein